MTVQDKPMTAVEPFNIPDPATSLTPMQEYLFDLNGYLVLEGAISPDDVAAMNATYDAIAAANIEGKGWFGRVGVSNSARQEGMVFEQLYEAGPVWEKLIDHPAWFNKVAHFVGSDDPENFDNHHGLFKVTEGVYQLRGFDISNMSIIEGNSGWIIVDPLTGAYSRPPW